MSRAQTGGLGLVTALLCAATLWTVGSREQMAGREGGTAAPRGVHEAEAGAGPAGQDHQTSADAAGAPRVVDVVRESATRMARTGREALPDAPIPATDPEEFDFLLRYNLDPEVALLRSLDAAEKRYESERRFLRRNYTRELQYAFDRIAYASEGTSDWPEAMFYLGLAHEANGHYRRRLSVYPAAHYDSVRGIYEAALSAAPPPGTEISLQLEYRLALYDYIGEWYPLRGDPAPGASLQKAKERLERLRTQDLRGVQTTSGAPMDKSVDMFLQACSERDSIAGVRAKLAVTAELFPWPDASSMRVQVERSVAQWLDGDGAEPYRQYVEDPNVLPVEKASLECRLTDLCLHMHQDPARAVRHAELAVALSPPDRQDVLANASAGLVVAYFEAGERTKAVGLATSVLASPGAGTLSYGRRRDVEWIARHGEE